MRQLSILTAATLAFGLSSSMPALAQQGPFAAIKDAIFSVVDFVRSPLEGDVVTPVTTPTSPTSIISSVQGGSMFWEGLRDAGYEVKEVTTGVGIIPDIKMSFQLVRELSDADRDWVERRIEIDEQRRGGLTAVLQRQILRTLLAASDLQDMRITKLDITLLPLPAAEFVMEPKESALSEEHDALLRALQGHTKDMMRGVKMEKKPTAAADTLD